MVEQQKYSKHAIIAAISFVLFVMLYCFNIFYAFNYFESSLPSIIMILMLIIAITGIIFAIIALVKISKNKLLKGKFNAIFVLIIFSIILLLSIVAFITNHSHKDKVIPEEPEAPSATTSEPITISRTDIRVSPGDETYIKVNLFNILNNTLYQAEPLITCLKPDNKIIATSPKIDITANSSAKYHITLNMATDIPRGGVYICTVCFKHASSNNQCDNKLHSKDWILRVR